VIFSQIIHFKVGQSCTAFLRCAQAGLVTTFKMVNKIVPFSVIALIPDILDFVLLLVAIYGMYQGIEISHPVYALLFSNLVFPFVVTTLNLTFFLILPFNTWTRLSLYGNVLSIHFHMTSWSIISVLRYVYIEHKEWIERKWSGPKELRYIALFAQFFSFSAANLIDLGLLAVFATPYGWPSNSLITQVPQNVLIFLVPCLAFLFTLPVVVSGIFYVLLVCSRSRSCSRSSLRSGSKKKFSNKDEVDWSIPNRENIEEKYLKLN